MDPRGTRVYLYYEWTHEVTGYMLPCGISLGHKSRKFRVASFLENLENLEKSGRRNWVRESREKFSILDHFSQMSGRKTMSQGEISPVFPSFFIQLFSCFKYQFFEIFACGALISLPVNGETPRKKVGEKL